MENAQLYPVVRSGSVAICAAMMATVLLHRNAVLMDVATSVRTLYFRVITAEHYSLNSSIINVDKVKLII